jgi:hypothetical protein
VVVPSGLVKDYISLRLCAAEGDHNRKNTCKLQLQANNSLEEYSQATYEYLAHILFKKTIFSIQSVSRHTGQTSGVMFCTTKVENVFDGYTRVAPKVMPPIYFHGNYDTKITLFDRANS